MDEPAAQPSSQPPPPHQQQEAASDSSRPITANKHEERLQKKKAAALQKLDKVRQSFEKQLATLTQQQEHDRHRAQLIEVNTSAVDAAIASVNVEVARGTDWTELQRILKDERDRGNPIARMIVALDLPTNTVTLALSQSMAHVRAGWVDEGREEDAVEEVELDLGQSAYNNASSYYTQRKQQGAKVNKTTETSERALRAVERRTAQQLKDSDARARIQQVRRSYWWEKYHWFVTSENFLVIAGRDTKQSQLIAQRHMAASDVYVCADVAGAVGVIVKNSTAAAVPPLSIQQAACMCLCRSSAWMGKPGSGGGEAWWVRGDEVEVSNDDGKVGLRTGVVRRYVTRMPLVMGLAVLFRVSDECVAAHKGERRIKGGVFDEKKDGEKKEEDDEDGTEEENEAHSEGKDGDGDDEQAEHDDEHDDEDEDSDYDDRQRVDETWRKQQSSGPSAAAATGTAELLTAAVSGMNLRGADVTAAARQLGAASDDANKIEEDGQSSHSQHSKSESANTKTPKKKVSVAEKRRQKKAVEHSQTGSANSVSADDDNSSEDHRESRAASRQQADRTSKGSKPVAGQLTRAQRAKQKKLAKYAEQDDEDRSIAAQVLGLQTSKRRDSSNKQHSEQREDEGETEQRVEDEQDNRQAAAAAPPTAVDDNAAAADKPVATTSPDHTTAVRTSKEKGSANRDGVRPPRRPAQQQDETATDEQAASGYPLDAIDALTGRPVEADKLQFALCVCAPYSALIDYKYRVKLLPGSQKRGKVVQAALSLWTRAVGGREAERDMMRGMREDEAMGVLCANVKVAAGMAGDKNRKRRKEGGGKEAAD